VLEFKGDPNSSHRTYSFNLGQVPVTPNTVQISGSYSQGWITLSDNGSGTLRGFVYSWKNKNLTGTVNYTTGAVTVDFGQASLDNGTSWIDAPIDSGLTSVRANYRPVVSDRVVAHSGNTFTDSFAPNAVHIYKVGPTAGINARAEQLPKALCPQLYPNPAVTELMVPTATGKAAFYTLQGKLAEECVIRNGRINLNTTQLTNGVYWVTVEGMLGAQKVMIVR
jgi:hypothetical protein